MNNYGSSNFATVVFLVFVFVVLGLLIYHTYELTVENRQLKDGLLAIENAKDGLIKEIEKLRAELDTLRAQLTDAAAEIASLKSALTAALDEVEKLRAENAVLKSQPHAFQAGQPEGEEIDRPKPKRITSSILPFDDKFLTGAVVAVLMMALLVSGLVLRLALRDRYLWAHPVPRTANGPSRQVRYDVPPSAEIIQVSGREKHARR